MRFSRIVLVVSLVATLALAVTVDGGETRPAKTAAPDRVRVAVCDYSEPAAGRTVSLVVFQHSMRCAPLIASPSPDWDGFARSIGRLVEAVSFGELLDWLASLPDPAAVPVTEPSQSAAVTTGLGGGGGNEGGHSDAWWEGVAMCEQGGRNDPYFGYFSFMDGSQGGRSWDEQVAAGNALLARAGREVGPWAQACVNAGYAASPGG